MCYDIQTKVVKNLISLNGIETIEKFLFLILAIISDFILNVIYFIENYFKIYLYYKIQYCSEQ